MICMLVVMCYISVTMFYLDFLAKTSILIILALMVLFQAADAQNYNNGAYIFQSSDNNSHDTDSRNGNLYKTLGDLLRSRDKHLYDDAPSPRTYYSGTSRYFSRPSDDFPPYPDSSYNDKSWTPKIEQKATVCISIPLTALSAILSEGQISSPVLPNGPAPPSLGELPGSAYVTGIGDYNGQPGAASVPSLLNPLNAVLSGAQSPTGQFDTGNSFTPIQPVQIPRNGGKYGNFDYSGGKNHVFDPSSYETTNGGDFDSGDNGGDYNGHVGSSYPGNRGPVIPVYSSQPANPASILAPLPPPVARPAAPISNLPGTGSLGNPSNLPCPRGAGYYRHPLDCSRYYRCVDGNPLNSRGFKIYEFSCPLGTVYSVIAWVCVWPHQVEAGSCYSPDSPPPLPPPIGQLGATGPSPYSESSPSYRGSGGAYDDRPGSFELGSDDTQMTVVSPGNSGLLQLPETSVDSDKLQPSCSKTGYFVHPSDCTQFAQCTSSSNGNISGRYFKCPPGKAFNPKVPVCENPLNIQDLPANCLANFK